MSARAGVINFLLKDDRSGSSLEFNTGTYRAGDGDAYTMAGNVGLPGTGLVFRSLRGKPLSNTTLSKLIKELGLAAVPHGFRSSFRDWAAERTNTPREVVEAALAHTVQNPTEAAYARSDLFERRRRLMDDWASDIETR